MKRVKRVKRVKRAKRAKKRAKRCCLRNRSKRLSIREDAGRLSRFEVIISPAREAQGARKTFIFGMFSVWRMQVT